MTDDPFIGLPEVLQEIGRVAGVDAVRQLVWGHGGRIVYIPQQAPPGHWLVDCVGRAAADAICKHYRILDAEGRASGIELQIPMAGTGVMRQAKGRLAKLLADGALSPPRAARLCGLHERTAWRLKAKLQSSEDTDQGDLFDP